MEFTELWNPSIVFYGVRDEARTSSSNDGRDCNSAVMLSLACRCDSLISEVEESPYASIRKAFVIWQMRNAR